MGAREEVSWVLLVSQRKGHATSRVMNLRWKAQNSYEMPCRLCVLGRRRRREGEERGGRGKGILPGRGVQGAGGVSRDMQE